MRKLYISLTIFLLLLLAVPIVSADETSYSGAANVTTNHPPTCAIIAPPNGYSTTTGVSVAFACTASSPDNSPLTYFWQFGDSGTSAQQLPSHTYSSAGDYSVSLTVTDNVGLTGSDSITVHITTPGGGTGGTGGGTTYYNLTTTINGAGSVTLSTHQIIVSTTTTQYASGTVVTLTAAPDNGWYFDHWNGDITGSANPTTITMSANKSVTAYFTQIPPSENWENFWKQPVQTPAGPFPLWEILLLIVAMILAIIALAARWPKKGEKVPSLPSSEPGEQLHF